MTPSEMYQARCSRQHSHSGRTVDRQPGPCYLGHRYIELCWNAFSSGLQLRTVLSGDLCICLCLFYSRPTRREVASYLGRYPDKVGIADAVYNNVEVSGIARVSGGFQIRSHDIFCKHIVIATGTFSNLIPPRSLLHPLAALSQPPNESSTYPIMVVGSGFSAADVIISTSRAQPIIHIFKWNPSKSPSPLRACHQQAYPEYAGVYRRMKLQQLWVPTRLETNNPSPNEKPHRRLTKAETGQPHTRVCRILRLSTYALKTAEL